MTVSINGTDLISLADYKTLAGISSSSEDTKLGALIDSVSQLVKTYCGVSFLDFYSSAKTEYISNLYATHLLPLTESPVRQVQSVKERSSPTDDYIILTVNTDFVLDGTTDSLFRVEGTSYKSWASGPNAIEVTYTAGYESLPKDLRLAVVDLVTYYHKNEQKQRQTIAGATIQNQSTSSTRNSVAFPDHIKRVLDLYKVLLMAQAEVDKLLRRAYKFADDTWARKGLDKSVQQVTVTRGNLRNAFKEAFSKEHAKEFKRAKNPFIQNGKLDNKPFDNAVDAAFKALLTHLEQQRTLSNLNRPATKNRIVFDQPRALKTPFTTLKNAGIKQINKELKARRRKELSDTQKSAIKTGVERLHTDTTVGMARLAYTLEQLEKNSVTAKFFASREYKSLREKYGDVSTEYQIKKIKGKKQIRYIGAVSLYLDAASKNFAGSEHNDWKKVRPKLEKALAGWLATQNLADQEGSISPAEDYKREAVSEVLDKFKTVKRAKIKRKTAQPSKKSNKYKPRQEKGKVLAVPNTVVPAQIAKARGKSRQENVSSANTVQMLGIINEQLPEEVRENMQAPRLQNRTGRFANSVRVTDIAVTNTGLPSVGYTYDRDNYEQYEKSSGSRWADTDRDPRTLIDKSIREIAAGLAIGRFFTRRV